MGEGGRGGVKGLEAVAGGRERMGKVIREIEIERILVKSDSIG